MEGISQEKCSGIRSFSRGNCGQIEDFGRLISRGILGQNFLQTKMGCEPQAPVTGQYLGHEVELWSERYNKL